MTDSGNSHTAGVEMTMREYPKNPYYSRIFTDFYSHCGTGCQSGCTGGTTTTPSGTSPRSDGRCGTVSPYNLLL